MELTLDIISEMEFNDYFENKLKRYANAIEKEITQNEHDAMEKAKIQMNKFLPKGLETPNHFIFNIHQGENTIGYLWINLVKENQSAFLYDIYIKVEYRGNGLGREAISKAEVWLRQFNIRNFNLHVFGSNNLARNLYEKIGFKITNIYMKKELD